MRFFLRRCASVLPLGTPRDFFLVGGPQMPRGSSHRGRHGSIVGFYPCLHGFRRFHLKARFPSHQDKGRFCCKKYGDLVE